MNSFLRQTYDILNKLRYVNVFRIGNNVGLLKEGYLESSSGFAPGQNLLLK